uniref:VWFA domain-containing protein n=1 Tax=Fundulus heteroclitus TaxID=8078 RepID=A0A3Q2NVZ6_FUNHE
MAPLSRETFAMDVVFLFDHSGSINSNDHQRLKEFTVDIVNTLPDVGQKLVHYGLAQFAAEPKHEFYLNNYYQKTEVVGHILGVEHEGGDTYLGKALRFIKEYLSPAQGGRSDVPRTVVVFTDGNAHDYVEEPGNELRGGEGVNETNIIWSQIKSLNASSCCATAFRAAAPALGGRIGPDVSRFCPAGPLQCPAYPTELVFGLDMSSDVGPADFREQRQVVLSMLKDVSIAEGNCPKGARVSVVAYSRHTKRLVRFQEHRGRKQLMEAVENLALERTTERRHLGAAMRFVGRNVFKRVRAGRTTRKVAVFFSNGQPQDPSNVAAAVMEYRAQNIILAVIALKSAPGAAQTTCWTGRGSRAAPRFWDERWTTPCRRCC